MIVGMTGRLFGRKKGAVTVATSRPVSRDCMKNSQKRMFSASASSGTPIRLVQFINSTGRRLGVVTSPSIIHDITSVYSDLNSTYTLFSKTQKQNTTLTHFFEAELKKITDKATKEDYTKLLKAKPGNSSHLLPPLDHPSHPMMVVVSGTGLTHLGSTEARDEMHKKAGMSEKDKTDSQKMFEMGLKAGKPAEGTRGVSPEWFYKGNGSIIQPHNSPLDIPPFADDGGEEPEIAGCYIIDEKGRPNRVGFTLCNEWSDHITEKVNYLWLAPSKLRQIAIGPELVLTPLFKAHQGYCRIYRGDSLLYDSGTLWTGEDHMSHSLNNIEDHHFKYDQMRVPGTVHIHTFGTSKLSISSGRISALQTGDRIEISYEGFGSPLVSYVNKYKREDIPVKVIPQ